MTYRRVRVSVYCSNQDHDTCDMRDVCTSTMTTCKQYAAKFEDFQNMKFTELSQSAFTFMNIYIILTFLCQLFNVKCSKYCVHRMCVNRSLSGYTPDFSAYIAVKTVVSICVSNSWIYTYSTRWETGYGETVNNYRWTNPCFLWKLSKLRAAPTFSMTVTDSLQPSNVAITPPEGI